MFRSLDLQNRNEQQQQQPVNFTSHIKSILVKLKKRLFKANALLLHHQIVREPVYHLILLFEFLQQMFLVYYPVVYRDGFVQQVSIKLSVDTLIPKIVSQLQDYQP